MNFSNHTISSGPYALVDYKKKDHLTLVPNNNYHITYQGNVLPNNDGINYYYIDPDASQRPLVEENKINYLWLTIDQADYFVNTKMKQMQLKKSFQKDWKLSQIPSSNVWMLGFNLDKKNLGINAPNTKNLRQAIQLALNFDSYLKEYGKGFYYPAIGAIPKGIFGYETQNQIMLSDEKRLEKAKQLVANIKQPIAITLTNAKILSVNLPIDWMKKRLALIGITLKVENVDDIKTYVDNINHGKYGLFIYAWGLDYPDPQNVLALFYGPDSQSTHHGVNMFNYQNPEFDKLYEEILVTPNSQKRLALIHKATALLAKDLPMIPMLSDNVTIMHRKNLENINTNPYLFNSNQYLKNTK